MAKRDGCDCCFIQRVQSLSIYNDKSLNSFRGKLIDDMCANSAIHYIVATDPLMLIMICFSPLFYFRVSYIYFWTHATFTMIHIPDSLYNRNCSNNFFSAVCFSNSLNTLKIAELTFEWFIDRILSTFYHLSESTCGLFDLFLVHIFVSLFF